MCYNKELCERMMAVTEKRLDAHAAQLDELGTRTTELYGKLDSLVTQLGSTNRLLWWVVGVFGTISTGTMVALIGFMLK
ncbi:MAG: hypothetical protein HFG20_07430 [Anaerotruncus sp.]|nr:hypothetical protein [Anaerotruncus sp.]